MINLLELIFLTSIMVLAWIKAIDEEMIFEKVGDWAEQKSAEGIKWVRVFSCPFCAPTIFVLPAFALAHFSGIVNIDSWRYIFYYPLVLMGASVVSGFTWTVYLTLIGIKDKNEKDVEMGYDDEEYYGESAN